MAVDNKLGWLAGLEFSGFFVWLIAVCFCLVLGYWVWDKYGKPKKTLLEQEKVFDELDAVEAESADEAELIQAAQAEPQLNQQPQQEGADVVPESHETQKTHEPRPSGVPVQLDLLGFSTKQK